MFGSATLEIAIGLILVFLLFSIMLTAIVELIEAKLKSRAVDLEQAIRGMLSEPETTAEQAKALATAFYKHPLIFPLYKETEPELKRSLGSLGLTTGGNLPSYIPRDVFSAALIDLVKTEQAPAALERVYRSLDATFGDDLARRKAQLESWYDGVMDRASGWYKRRMQRRLFWIGLAGAIVFNINTIAIVQYLSESEDTRSALVELATKTVAAGERATDTTQDTTQSGDAAAAPLTQPAPEAEGQVTQPAPEEEGQGSPAPRLQCPDDGVAEDTEWARIARCRKALADVGLPVGWSALAWESAFPERAPPTGLLSLIAAFWSAPGHLLLALIGWSITALAGTLGAPFWFDLLNKIMVVRATVKPKEKSGDEGSEDRAPASRRTGAGAPPKRARRIDRPASAMGEDDGERPG